MLGSMLMLAAASDFFLILFTFLHIVVPWTLDQNPSCWTGGFTYDICCKGDGHLAGCWGDDADLSPHKYERCCQSPCGANLRQKIEGSCSNVLERNRTIVTGLWDLGRHKWAAHARYKDGAERTYGKYLQWFDLLLAKPEAMVLFLDAEAAAFARNQRATYGLEELTCVVDAPMHDLPQMRWRDSYEAAHLENMRNLPGDTQPEVIHASYTLAVNSKPELLACAASWNPFGSTKFAWVDAGVGRKDGFPKGDKPIVLPSCAPWTLCVGRRPWIFFDFRGKLRRLRYGSTFDSTVLVGGPEGVLLYALWFQWAVAQYLSEMVMDDEQSLIAEVWWTGMFNIGSIYGMTWTETTTQMLQAGFYPEPSITGTHSIDRAWMMGRWFCDHPHIIWRNNGVIWIPSKYDLTIAQQTPVNQITDDDLERIAYAHWCQPQNYDYYKSFCGSYRNDQTVEFKIDDRQHLPVVGSGTGVVHVGLSVP